MPQRSQKITLEPHQPHTFKETIMKTASRFSLICSLIWICLVVVLTSPAFAQAPHITSVFILGDNGSYTLTINGQGFGSPTVTLPYTGDVSNFRIGDAALGQPPAQGNGEWGYTGDVHVLTYQSWSDSSIVVSGMGGSAGDAITLAVWNASTGQGVTWAGNLRPSVRITHVAHSGTGANLHMTIYGSGFGPSPVAMPYTGDLNYFEFTDFRTHCDGAELFNAGLKLGRQS